MNRKSLRENLFTDKKFPMIVSLDTVEPTVTSYPELSRSEFRNKIVNSDEHFVHRYGEGPETFFSWDEDEDPTNDGAKSTRTYKVLAFPTEESYEAYVLDAEDTDNPLQVKVINAVENKIFYESKKINRKNLKEDAGKTIQQLDSLIDDMESAGVMDFTDDLRSATDGAYDYGFDDRETREQYLSILDKMQYSRDPVILDYADKLYRIIRTYIDKYYGVRFYDESTKRNNRKSLKEDTIYDELSVEDKQIVDDLYDSAWEHEFEFTKDRLVKKLMSDFHFTKTKALKLSKAYFELVKKGSTYEESTAYRKGYLKDLRESKENFSASVFYRDWAKAAANVAESYLCNDEEDYDKIKSFEGDSPTFFDHYVRGDAVLYIYLRSPFDNENTTDILNDVEYMVKDDYDYFIDKVNKKCERLGVDTSFLKKVKVDDVSVKHEYDSSKHQSTTYIFVAFDITLKDPEIEPNYKHPIDTSNWTGPDISNWDKGSVSSYDAAGIGWQSYSSSPWK